MYFQAIVNSFSGLGPFCFHFNKDERHTVLTLKQKLEQATAVGVNQQRLRSMAGRLLTDSDLLFSDQLNLEPVILNMTVRLIGGCNSDEDDSCYNNNNNNNNNESSMAFSQSSQLSLADQPMKKYKMNCGQHTFITSSRSYQKEKMNIEKQESKSRRKEEEEEEPLVEKKGKQKETRKRKIFAA